MNWNGKFGIICACFFSGTWIFWLLTHFITWHEGRRSRCMTHSLKFSLKCLATNLRKPRASSQDEPKPLCYLYQTSGTRAISAKTFTILQDNFLFHDQRNIHYTCMSYGAKFHNSTHNCSYKMTQRQFCGWCFSPKERPYIIWKHISLWVAM